MPVIPRKTPDAAADTTPAVRPARRPDPARLVATTTLARLLADLGLADLAEPIQSALETPIAIRGEFAAARKQIDAERDAIRARVIDGKMSVRDALLELSDYSAVTGSTDAAWASEADWLMSAVIADAEAAAVDRAAKSAAAIFKALHDRAAAAITSATAAARELVPLDQAAKAIAASLARNEWDGQAGRLQGWPQLDIGAVPFGSFGAVGQLRAANAEYDRLREAAGWVAAIDPTIGTVMAYKQPPARSDQECMRWVPEELRVPVAAAVGWQPGIWRRADTKPRPHREASDIDAERTPAMPGGRYAVEQGAVEQAIADVSAGNGRRALANFR